MKKRFWVTLILITLLSLSGTVLAVKKKPKLVLPATNKAFATTSMGITTNAAVRANYNTPQEAKLYLSEALFDWNTPECSKTSTCDVFIGSLENGKIIPIHKKENITSKIYIYTDASKELKRGKSYVFYVKGKAQGDNILDAYTKEPVLLYFYYLSDTEKTAISKQIAKIAKNTNKIDQIIDETNILLKNGIWFDSIHNIDKLITKDPANKEYTNFKNQLKTLLNDKNNKTSPENKT